MGGAAVDLRPKLAFLMVFAVLLAALGANSASGPASANLAALLNVTPKNAVPNQTVTLFGNGFTPATAAGGGAQSGAHQITGQGASVIIVNGVLLASPHVTYPINFDSSGSWAASITIPVTPEIIAGGPVQITAIDDQGIAQTTQVGIKKPSITLTPASGGRSSDLSITGQGFPASNSATTANFQVSITYSGVQLHLVSPNFLGEIVAPVKVPATAAALSTNIVRATVVGFNRFAFAVHSVTGPTITLSPVAGRPGAVVTITGEGFQANIAVSSTRAGNITVSGSTAPITDNDGKFVTFFVVPLFSPGVQTVTATAGGTTAVNSFTVLEGSVVTQPTPTPQAPTGTAQALSVLTESDNLVRVWNFDNTTKRWTFFDPRPAFAKANTIRNMVSGRIYWLMLNRDQPATLNGKVSLLYQGWNLIPW